MIAEFQEFRIQRNQTIQQASVMLYDRRMTSAEPAPERTIKVRHLLAFATLALLAIVPLMIAIDWFSGKL